MSIHTIQPRLRFSRRFVLSAADVRAFATLAEDANPIHHDARYASTTRFGGIIASGAQLSAMLMGVTATYFSSVGEMVGLEFTFRFRKHVMVNESIVAEWLVIRAAHKSSLGGALVDLRGRILRSDGATAVGAAGKVLVTESL